jgi:hypothetical protein
MRALSLVDTNTISAGVNCYNCNFMPESTWRMYQDMAHNDGVSTAIFTGCLSAGIAASILSGMTLISSAAVIAAGASVVAATSLGYTLGYNTSEVW